MISYAPAPLVAASLVAAVVACPLGCPLLCEWEPAPLLCLAALCRLRCLFAGRRVNRVQEHRRAPRVGVVAGQAQRGAHVALEPKRGLCCEIAPRRDELRQAQGLLGRGMKGGWT